MFRMLPSVTKQASGLTTIIADELERQFLTAYFVHVCHDADFFQQLESETGSK